MAIGVRNRSSKFFYAYQENVKTRSEPRVVETAIHAGRRSEGVVLGAFELRVVRQLAWIHVEEIVGSHCDLEFLRHVVADFDVGDVAGRVLEMKKLRSRERVRPDDVGLLTRRGAIACLVQTHAPLVQMPRAADDDLVLRRRRTQPGDLLRVEFRLAVAPVATCVTEVVLMFTPRSQSTWPKRPKPVW